VDTDEDLLGRWRDGDKAAGERLFDRHFDALFRFFCTKSEAAAEDLTQETLLACVRGKGRIRLEHRFRAYMFAVARRVLHAHYERSRRRDVPIGSQSAVDLSPGITTLMSSRAEERLLVEALRRLPLDYQIALELHTWEGLTGPEIAGVLDVPEGTIRSRLRRARQQLEATIRELATSQEVLRSTLTSLDAWAADLRQHGDERRQHGARGRL
jgi:RNA polymerase sigma factor (sigma-70 family)